MKRIIVYVSKTGFTEKYAKWLAEKVGCECIPIDKAFHLADYDQVIFASWLCAGKIKKLDWYKKLKKTDKVILVTGASPMENEDTKLSLKKNFKENEWKDYHVFYVESGLNYEKMRGLNRIVMKLVSKMTKKNHSSVNQIKSFSYDNAHPNHLKEITAYLNNQK